MSFETVLASERVYEGHIVNLRVDQIRTPTGLEALREIVEHRGAVAMVVLDDQLRVILVKQYRHAVGAETIEVPAGTLDTVDEDPLEAAQRELREETGFRAVKIEPIGGIYPSPAWSTEYIHFYLMTDLIPGPSATEADEAIEMLRVPLPETIEMIRSGAITDGKSVSALLLAEAWLRFKEG